MCVVYSRIRAGLPGTVQTACGDPYCRLDGFTVDQVRGMVRRENICQWGGRWEEASSSLDEKDPVCDHLHRLCRSYGRQKMLKLEHTCVRKRGSKLCPHPPQVVITQFYVQPQVLESDGSSYASDVYSFGVVVWEVITRELPWAEKTRPREILTAVLRGSRPSFHPDAPCDIADIAKACWSGEPKERTTFRAILEGMKANGWGNE